MSRTSKIGVILLALLLSSSAYVYGVLHHVDNSHYTGLRSINASDYNPTLSWIQQFREGQFLLRNLYTSEPHDGIFIRPIYFAMSWPLVHIFHSNSVVMHIMRLLCGLALLISLFPLLRTFLESERTTTLAFSLIVFSSGAGILLRSLVPDSADLTIPEAILFLTLGEPAHFLYSLLLLWIGIVAVYRLTLSKPGSLPLFILSLVLLWWEHPFDAVTLVALTLFVLWQVPTARTKISVLFVILIVSIPPALYYKNLQKIPVFAGWASQNVMTSPSLPGLLSAYLPLLLLAFPGAIILQRKVETRRRTYFLLSWIAVQFILTYMPFAFQRRLIAGVQFPLVALAAIALAKFPKAAAVSVISLLSAGNVFVSFQQIKDVSSGRMPFYLPQDYQEAFRWLADRKPKGAVMSGYVTGNFIPAYTGCAVFAGHSALTPDIQKKKEQIARFYANPTEEFLKANHLIYTFWGLEERNISKNGFPFAPLYRNDSVVISGTDQISPLFRASLRDTSRTERGVWRCEYPQRDSRDPQRTANHTASDR